MKRAVLAIDQGTTSSRAMVIGHDGQMIGEAQRAIPPIYPRPGWVNHDANHLWYATLDVAREAIARSGLAASDLAGIGIANQRETTILWDRATGEPVAPAIVWQSRQSSRYVNAIAERDMSATYQRITGLVPDAYFSATKIAWLLDDQPELRRRAEAGELCFGTVDSWLMWRLSGGREHVIDVTNASRTMLFDIRAGGWSDELLDDLQIPRAILPGVVESSGALFETAPELFGASIPVAGVAGDQQAALFGQACFRPGEAKNTYGTGSFLLMNTGERAIASPCNLLTTIAASTNGQRQYALEGAIFVTGSAVQWLRDGLGIVAQASDVEALASSVADSQGVVFVPALVGLGAPYWDQQARGTIVGITRGTTAAHLARATLEAIAFQTRDVIDAMEVDSGVGLTELRVDGGASRNDLLMQIQADALGVPVVRPAMTETTALGAAYLAGIGTGFWHGQDEIRERWREDRRFEPRVSEPIRNRACERWRRAVERARAWEIEDYAAGEP
ncbi:MAG: glycerol kinase GlpK [Thermomicrobiales bacterium]|nr:glycerol kinase GlpK [Thermomicrobiales bacterium]